METDQKTNRRLQPILFVSLLALIILLGFSQAFSDIGPVEQSNLTSRVPLATSRELLISNPKLFLSRALSGEKEELIGVLEVTQHDDWDNPAKARLSYKLRVDGKQYDFYPVGNLAFESGSRIHLKQAYVSGDLAVAEVTSRNIQVIEPPPTPPTLGEQKVAVIMVDFTDSPAPPFDKEEAERRIFKSQINNFYREQSYGRVSLAGKTYGWFTLPRAGGDANSCPLPTLGNGGELDQFILDNFRPELYDRYVVLLNQPCFMGGQSTIGKRTFNIGGHDVYISLAYIGASPIWNNPRDPANQNFSWTWFDYIVAHEFGHGLGLYHANGWDCGTQSLYALSGNCQQVEYGNHFDVMGWGIIANHFNAFYKERLGWLKPEEILLINRPGRYKLNALEETGGPKIAKIKPLNSNNTPFYLEYRRGLGFDSFLNDQSVNSNQQGLLINLISGVGQNPTRLLDLLPTNADWHPDSKLASVNIGSVFSDIPRGVSIAPTAISTSTITFDIKLSEGACDRARPQIANLNFFPILSPGSNGFVYFNLINQDSVGCSPANFTVTVALPDDWQNNLPIGDQEIAPQESVFNGFNFSIPAAATLMTYPITITAINNDSDLKTVETLSITVVPPPHLESVVPPAAAPGEPIVLFGSGLALASTVNFYNEIGLTSIGVASSSDEVISISVPDIILGTECGCLLPTPPGVYQVSIFSSNGIMSNFLPFEVISASTPIPISEPLKRPGLDQEQILPLMDASGKLDPDSFGDEGHEGVKQFEGSRENSVE